MISTSEFIRATPADEFILSLPLRARLITLRSSFKNEERYARF